MPTVFGPYWECHDSEKQLYLLYKTFGSAKDNSQTTALVKESSAPILKEPVSLLLNEVMKPRRIFATPTLITSSSQTPDDSVIRAAIAMMDETVVRVVRAAKSDVEAIIILALYDPRFEDWGQPQEVRDHILRYFRPPEDDLKTTEEERPRESEAVQQSVKASTPERIRIILRRHTNSYAELKGNPEKRLSIFADLDAEQIPVIRSRKSRQPWATAWSQLRPNTNPYRRVMTSLARYYSAFKRTKAPTELNRAPLVNSDGSEFGSSGK
jgi:hypothetical protein